MSNPVTPPRRLAAAYPTPTSVKRGRDRDTPTSPPSSPTPITVSDYSETRSARSRSRTTADDRIGMRAYTPDALERAGVRRIISRPRGGGGDEGGDGEVRHEWHDVPSDAGPTAPANETGPGLHLPDAARAAHQAAEDARRVASAKADARVRAWRRRVSTYSHVDSEAGSEGSEGSKASGSETDTDVDSIIPLAAPPAPAAEVIDLVSDSDVEVFSASEDDEPPRKRSKSTPKRKRTTRAQRAIAHLGSEAVRRLITARARGLCTLLKEEGGERWTFRGIAQFLGLDDTEETLKAIEHLDEFLKKHYEQSCFKVVREMIEDMQ